MKTYMFTYMFMYKCAYFDYSAYTLCMLFSPPKFQNGGSGRCVGISFAALYVCVRTCVCVGVVVHRCIQSMYKHTYICML